ncbi:MAG TPA: tetratricopeptide repeat protein [Puia sp.]|nr:tetratricopeptide repeat protein [Puia sp.]
MLSFALYINTIRNEYALDDGLVIIRNEYVQEGLGGISDILTKDAYDSYYRQLNNTNQLKGGRYRPLSILTFAIEQEFMGAPDQDSVEANMNHIIQFGMNPDQRNRVIHEMHIRHFFNIIWYTLCVLALLYFLRYIVFRNNPIVAFVAAIIFTVHPIHTEVVANVKSRDEIMSLLFICLTFIGTFKYQELGKKWIYAAALLSYFLALLSKEYAITLVILLPLSLYLFNRNSISRSMATFVPFLIPIAAYLYLRLQTSVSASETADTEVLNNPYLYASAADTLATKIATSFNYLRLLIFPHPLSADYSYNSIPYKNFSSPLVWLSLLVHLGLLAAMLRFFPRIQGTATLKGSGKREAQLTDYRSILCFGIAFYLFNLLLICNIFFNIGGTMGERLIFHSSVGFAIAAGFLICRGFELIKEKRARRFLFIPTMAIIILLSGYKTISRNAEWKNDETLFSADLKTVPNSVLVNGNVVTALVNDADLLHDSTKRRAYLVRAVALADHAIKLDPVYVAGFFNRGLAWFKLGDLDKAKSNMDSVKAHFFHYPLLPLMYRQIATMYGQKGLYLYANAGRWADALDEYGKGIRADSTNAELWYQSGIAYYQLQDLDRAVTAWQTALKFKPGYSDALRNLNFVLNLKNNDAQRRK